MENHYSNNDEVLSKIMRAGRRTYFFDVRKTKAEDYYLTITESKKFTNPDETFYFKKHKIYIYKEDFAEFKSLLDEVTNYIIQEKGESVISERHQDDYQKPDENEGKSSSSEVDGGIKFEDL